MTLSSVSLCEIWSEVKDWGGFFIFEHCQRHIQPSLVEYFCRMNCSNKTANKHKSSSPPSTSQPPTPLSPCSLFILMMIILLLCRLYHGCSASGCQRGKFICWAMVYLDGRFHYLRSLFYPSLKKKRKKLPLKFLRKLLLALFHPRHHYMLYLTICVATFTC